ncbi:MAG: hypothetical protein WBG02_15450 [Candidatus Acidiferrum sp.]
MVVIKGKVVQGMGVASLTLRLQMPYFAKLFPEIAGCHLASINMELEQGLRVVNPDYVSPAIPWAGGSGETFSFLRVSFEGPIGSPLHAAWLYIPHSSPHYYNPFSIEMIAAHIDGIHYSLPCQLHIPKPHKQAPLLTI